MDKLHYDRADYSVVVKNRAPRPKAWRWEIYRAGNANSIKQSSIYFDTTALARRAGKDALRAAPSDSPKRASDEKQSSKSPRGPINNVCKSLLNSSERIKKQ